mgnify:CR=1 FL=1
MNYKYLSGITLMIALSVFAGCNPKEPTPTEPEAKTTQMTLIATQVETKTYLWRIRPPLCTD